MVGCRAGGNHSDAGMWRGWLLVMLHLLMLLLLLLVVDGI